MFEAIQKLAYDVDAAWSRTGYAETEFSSIAAEILSQPLDLDFSTLARRICEGGPLPEQRRLDQGFGQPAITLHNGQRFQIEALCWHTATPAIHEHAFSGAFRVVTGSSVHSLYTFTERDSLGCLVLGSLKLERAEVLYAGSTRPIPRGKGLIHANFHLDSPTMTVVLRTHPVAEREFSYLPPGVAFDPAARTPTLNKRIQLLDTMHQTGHSSYLECLHAALRNSDEYDGMSIVMRAGARVDESLFHELTARLRASYGPKSDFLVAALTEERRRGVIVRLRSSVTDTDSRFFLACLLSFSRRADLLATMEAKVGSSQTARTCIAHGVSALLAGDEDRRRVSIAAAEAILDDVSAEAFPQWAAQLWQRSLSGDEACMLTGYYESLLQHPLLTPLLL